MNTVTISPKYQVVIPRAIREELGLKPGQKMLVVNLNGRLEIIPVRSPKELRGIFKGLDTTIDREEDRF